MELKRHQTREVKIGNVTVGGSHPVAVQSMLNISATDVEGNIRQHKALYEAGCEINRVAVSSPEEVPLIAALKEAVPQLPLVADIQFDFRLAVESAYAGADKIRINPGNIGDEEKIRQVVLACRDNHIPIRVGVNSGSLEKEILARFGGPTAQALVESALLNLHSLEKFDFYDYLVAMKSSDPLITVEAYREMAELSDCPLHLGVTEAGTRRMGTIKSAAALGSLLLDGIGDTIRVSLTADPVEEIAAAKDLLRAVGRSPSGIQFVSCPTCSRCKVNLLEIATQVEQALAGCEKNLKVAVMGCAVNGPGEAREADIGLAGGQGEMLLFKQGKPCRKVRQEEAVEVLLREIAAL